MQDAGTGPRLALVVTEPHGHILAALGASGIGKKHASADPADTRLADRLDEDGVAHYGRPTLTAVVANRKGAGADTGVVVAHVEQQTTVLQLYYFALVDLILRSRAAEPPAPAAIVAEQDVRIVFLAARFDVVAGDDEPTGG